MRHKKLSWIVNYLFPHSPNWNLNLPSLSKIWIRWLLVSATMMSFCAFTATPDGSVNWPSSTPNSPNCKRERILRCKLRSKCNHNKDSPYLQVFLKFIYLAVVDHFLTLDLRLRREHGTRWGSSCRETALRILCAVVLLLLRLQHLGRKLHNWLGCRIIAVSTAVIEMIVSSSIDVISC